MDNPPPGPSNLAFLAGGGEMGARMRALDWSKTPLGPPDRWPQSLRSTLSMLLPSKAQIILFWGPEFISLYNDAYRPVFGAKHPHFLGRPGREAWSEIWDSMLHELLDGVVRTGEAFWAKDLLFEVERYGFLEETYFDVSYDPVRVESGFVGGVFCIVTETTERVVGERRMALLKDLAAHNATARTARDACVLATETLAAKPQDVTFALAYLDGQLQSCTPGADEQLASGKPELVKSLPLFSSGAERPACQLVVGLNPRRPFDEHYRAFLDLVADQVGTALTNARAYEEERKRAEALAEIDRAKTAFFSNVSHEFRTPLTLLLGPVQDALDTRERRLDGDALATVHRNALRLLKLVNTLLDFARIEAGRLEASYEATDLAAFTTDLAGAFRSAVESAGLCFDVDCQPLDEPVHVDRSMWEKVVFNLLSNALKFTVDGRIRLSLARDGDHVRLLVSDTGIGIADDQLPHVFERFHRVRNARARTHEGTGIGLALVQELVRLHHGTIGIETAVGRGTTFTVTLPLRGRQPADGSAGMPRSQASTSVTADAYVNEALGWVERGDGGRLDPEPSQSGRARILLADDNADMRDYVARLLGERWRVDAVADGATALAAARAERPDLVLADVMMPELDGFELLAALRAEPETRDTPVVLLSARAGEEATLKGIAAGADDYLVKPFTARDLLARVDAQLRRAEAREAVRDRMAQIESLLNNAPLGVYLVDSDFRIVHVNPVAAPVFGDLPDLVGRDFDEVIHRLWTKDYADEIVRMFRQALETGDAYVTPERAEYRIDRGVIEYYEWRVVRIQLPDGRFGIVCYFRDVSAQVRARNTIAESEQRFRAFVTATSDIVYRMNADWTEMRQLDGRSFIADTVDPSQSWIENYIHPDDRETVLAAVGKAIDAKSTFELEHRVIRVDGTVGWIFSRAVPILHADGRIKEWVGTARDVTARKRGEQIIASVTAASEQQRRLYETILSTTPDLVYVFDLNHRFTYANEALLATWGKGLDEAIGRNCLELGYEPWHAEMHDREIDQVIATGQPIRGEVPFTGTQGRRMYDYIFVPVFGADGEVEAIAGAARDVTERKRSEDALRDSEQRLFQANRVKDEFLATLSHELRTPLNAVLGWAHMLRTGRLRPNVQERALQSLERNAKAQAQLVDDLLDVSRIMSGKLAMKSDAVDLTTVIAEAIDAVRPAMTAKGIRLGVDVDAGAEIVVNGDADRLQQVVWNLLSNAVKFTPARGTIDVELRSDGEHVEIVVRDSGEGIDPAFLPHVFERFRQADSGPARKHGGLGLGLAIVRHLTEAHGGTVSAHSQGPKKGATFIVRLPVEAASDGRRRSVEPEIGQRTGPSIDGVRVLIVDDEPDALELARVVLESSGADVTAVGSAEEVLNAMRQQTFDALVADIGMPGQDGYSLIRAIRGLPAEQGRSIRAIALTAYTTLRERQEALAAGFDVHLGKPVGPDQLVAAVAAAVRAESSH
jgi:PAS domain S-box-containing protein